MTETSMHFSINISDLVEQNGVERHALLWAELLQLASEVILDGFVGHVAAVSTNSALTRVLLGVVVFVQQFAACSRKKQQQQQLNIKKDSMWNRKQ